MSMYEFYEKLKKYALNSDNYKSARNGHAMIFGALFENAFSQSVDGQICLTAALIHISQRNFEAAVPLLNSLEQFCLDDDDRKALYYFKGLNYEMLEMAEKMEEYYGKLREFPELPIFCLFFHPYYRTARLAQKSSECSKALYYFSKAIGLHHGTEPVGNNATNVGHIMYDIATVQMYMHNYDQTERFLKLSRVYDKTENPKANYVAAYLAAVRGKREECAALVSTLNPILKPECEACTREIFAGRDLHYCIIDVDRSAYGDFVSSILSMENEIRDEEFLKDVALAEEKISELLTKTCSFMRRRLECKIEKMGDVVYVRCKNYRAVTLVEEYKVLLGMMPNDVEWIKLVSVDEFETFESFDMF